MEHIKLGLDPRVLAALTSMAGKRNNRSRVDLIRDALYTLVWTEHRGAGISLQVAPAWPPMRGADPGDMRIVHVAPEVYERVTVDEFGLMLEADEKRVANARAAIGVL